MNQNAPDFMECFTRLVATPSISSIDPSLDQGNRAVIEILAGWLEDLGFAIELMPVAGQSGKLNLVACSGQGEGGLVLSGHTDTVPCNAERWQQDPFTLTEKDNRLYGLGASDMKCFFPMVVDVIRNMDLKKINQPLYILATADEESNMSGARALAESGRKFGRHALIGEPTGLVPVNMHKGVLMETIRLIGRSGHSSNPALGNSALEGMHAVISALLSWRNEIQQQYTDNNFEVPVPTLNFGSIRGGDNPNRICAECVLTVDLRLLPAMDHDLIKDELHRVIMSSVAGSNLEVKIDKIFAGVPAMHTDADAEIIRLAENLSGHAVSTVAFGTEGPFLNSMGMETVILGPGNIDQAHQANEYLALDRIQPMMDILNRLIGHICIGDRKHVN